MRGAATKAMSDIVEERQQNRCPAAAVPLRAAARRPAGFVARSSHTAPGIARRSRLASGPGGQQQNVNLFLHEPLHLADQPGVEVSSLVESPQSEGLVGFAAETVALSDKTGRLLDLIDEKSGRLGAPTDSILDCQVDRARMRENSVTRVGFGLAHYPCRNPAATLDRKFDFELPFTVAARRSVG